MRGKLWTFIRPIKEGAVIRFLNSSGETFGAMYQAQRWLHENWRDRLWQTKTI